MTEEGFEKADSFNLPKVDVFMAAEFLNKCSFMGVEAKGVKAAR